MRSSTDHEAVHASDALMQQCRLSMPIAGRRACIVTGRVAYSRAHHKVTAEGSHTLSRRVESRKGRAWVGDQEAFA
jgi:hypothetical protein